MKKSEFFEIKYKLINKAHHLYLAQRVYVCSAELTFYFRETTGLFLKNGKKTPFITCTFS